MQIKTKNRCLDCYIPPGKCQDSELASLTWKETEKLQCIKYSGTDASGSLEKCGRKGAYHSYSLPQPAEGLRRQLPLMFRVHCGQSKPEVIGLWNLTQKRPSWTMEEVFHREILSGTLIRFWKRESHLLTSFTAKGFQSQIHSTLPMNYNLARQSLPHSRNISANKPQEFVVYQRNKWSLQKGEKKKKQI